LPWSYRKGNTFIHRLPAGFKLCFLLLSSLAAFFPGSLRLSLLIIASLALILLFASFVARITPHTLLRGSTALFLLVFAVFIARAVQFSPFTFTFEHLHESALFAARISVAFAAGSLLFAVTTPGEIRKFLTGFEASIGLSRLKIGLGIALMLGFLPQFFQIWEAVNLAFTSRGGGKSFSRLLLLIPIIMEKMMVKAGETAAAIESRGGNM